METTLKGKTADYKTLCDRLEIQVVQDDEHEDGPHAMILDVGIPLKIGFDIYDPDCPAFIRKFCGMRLPLFQVHEGPEVVTS